MYNSKDMSIESNKVNELVLIEYWPSPFVARVKIALEEKGVQNYESNYEDVHNAKSALLSEMNPVHKKVPVLIHKGKPVCESLTIVEYIDEVWKDKCSSLMPAHPYERARARFWADYNDKMFFSFIRKLWRQKDQIQPEEKKEFVNFLKVFEEELGDQPYFGGNNFGYLDIALIPNYSWFYSYETITNLNIEAECPKLIEWAKRCIERESVKKCLPDDHKIYNYVGELKKKFKTD